MNWQTHVPNIFGIDFNVTFIRFLHFFYTSTRVVIRVIITKINDNRFYDTSIYTVFFAVFFFNFDHMFLILILKVAIDATGPRVLFHCNISLYLFSTFWSIPLLFLCPLLPSS